MVTIPLAAVDAVRITILMDNVTDPLLFPSEHVERTTWLHQLPRPRRASTVTEDGLPDALIAEPGFSALVRVATGGRERTILFDAGVSPSGVVENMRRLELAPKTVEAIVLSHGHWDHVAGMEGIAKDVGRAGLPVLIHPQFWRRRRIAIPGFEPGELPATSRSALEGAGFEIVEEAQPSFLLDGSVLVTGEVDRVTPFEIGFLGHEAHVRGRWEPDPLILDDQAIVMRFADRGLVVLTGCGHAGIINIVSHAQRLTGETRVAAVIGGFHLSGPMFEPIIEPTVVAFDDLEPALLMPAHCTGWKAVHRLARRFPDAFVQSAVGTTISLSVDSR
jgi:7,8-dihydropterin-6-yl-methyl-4-(beta-D-ribofuranosyl)aminobenzene 5'-phosphate synthase